MGISLAPESTQQNDPLKPKPAAFGLAKGPPAVANITAAGTPAMAPLPTEYPSAPSTTGTPQNRLQLATNAFDTFARSTAPQYTADLREATQKAAGAGNLGSGMLRTTYGNLANQRALALDTERSNLINSATTGTIADQQASQGLGIQQQNADTARTSALGNLGVAQGTLGLETKKADTAASQTQQQIDIQRQTADINAKVAAGQLTVAEGQLALAKLSNQQSFGLETQKVALATAAQDVASKVQLGQLSIAQAQQALDEKVKTGELTVDQAKLALDQINSEAANKVNQQQANTAQAGQQATAANQAGQLQLAKEQLAQTGTQFGLSLAQQKELATIADKTQNRQLDISSAQGQASLALELARIMGAKDQNSIDPNFLAAISKALGFAAPTVTDPTAEAAKAKAAADAAAAEARKKAGKQEGTGDGTGDTGTGSKTGSGKLDTNGEYEFNADGTPNPKFSAAKVGGDTTETAAQKAARLAAEEKQRQADAERYGGPGGGFMQA